MEKTIAALRQLTALDSARLRKMAGSGSQPELDELLDEAEVIDSREVAPDIVTMYAQVEVEDIGSRSRRTLVVCYPADAEPARGFISVLSPVGLALLGLPVGAVARWQAPGGIESAARVAAILFQPEASGDYVT
ncbi:transcription elongation factor GreAB [Ramlibacter sp. RBP-2]|uniref:Transcription elongation factor GreAB n=1 Tax=Ramlibacter lithotrophicus TaxID=2606681 RepID=A0A7X6DJV0_9BURK|nr:GreA/GreB family elongation factor [Ramlibacter lithotrophicus]NKE68497.1 transcription elongation factor GreAB [Ramlibacter lithotrophicus]